MSKHIRIFKDPKIRVQHTSDKAKTLYFDFFIRRENGKLQYIESGSVVGKGGWYSLWIQWHAEWVVKAYYLENGIFKFLEEVEYDVRGKNVQMVFCTDDWNEAVEFLRWSIHFKKITGCKLFIASSEFNEGHFKGEGLQIDLGAITTFTEKYNSGPIDPTGVSDNTYVEPSNEQNEPIQNLYARYDLGTFPIKTSPRFGNLVDNWRIENKEVESHYNSISYKQHTKQPIGLIDNYDIIYDSWKNPVIHSKNQLEEFNGIVDKDVEIEELTSEEIVKHILGFRTKYWKYGILKLHKSGYKEPNGVFVKHESFSGGFHIWGKGSNKTRVAIQILSYNKPEYLKRTLDSLLKVMDLDDKICVVEQSDDKDSKQKAVDICKGYNDITLLDLDKNLGQRGATNKVWESGFFDNCKFIMFSDQDNEYHEPLTILCDKLEEEGVKISTFYNSPEHDIIKKDGSWIYRNTARAGNMMLTKEHMFEMLPIDENLYSETKTDKDYCAWFAGLDWWVQWWHEASGGKLELDGFVACYPGGCTHFGIESTWQGTYDDEIPTNESILMRDKNLQQIIKKYPNRHLYNHGKNSWYEKEKLDLSNVTLVVIDCIDYERALKAIDISTTYADFADVKFFTSMNKDNDDIIKIPHCQSNFDVIHFMWKKMNSYIQTDYILHIEFDGFILNPKAWKDEFLKYDYIGAPWWYEENNVGNAGFSLISKKMLDFIQKDEVIDLYPSDDDAICRINRKYLEDNGIKFAPEELAADFSFEANEKRGDEWDGQFGFHSPSYIDERHPNKYRGGITNVDKWEDKDNFSWP